MFEHLMRVLAEKRKSARFNDERKGSRRNRLNRALGCEQLERRKLHAVDIRYDAPTDLLTMTSNDASDSVEVSKSLTTLTVKVNGVNSHSQILKFNPVAKLSFVGNGGDDTFQNWTSLASTANGGGGIDTLKGGSGTDTFYGGIGGDHLWGGGGIDWLYGEAGIDFLNGDNGTDYLYGGTDGDTLYGGAGIDYLYGETGNDALQGGLGVDRLDGGANSDTYYFTSIGAGSAAPLLHLGTDTIVDVSGSDAFSFVGSAQGATVDLNKLDVQTVHSNLNVRIQAGTVIEHITGSNYNDVFTGNGSVNFFFGQGGDDRLYGRAGADSLDGGDGDDGLYGGAGVDYLYGRAGDDRYLRGPGDTDFFIGYVAAEDAQAIFRDGAAVTNQWFAGRHPSARWDIGAGVWTDAQIEQTDAALAKVQEATGNTRLLKRAGDPTGTTPLTYVMQGEVTQVAGPIDTLGIGAWNDPNTGELHFVDNTVVERRVFHEIGHNWDADEELRATWRREWLALSGWVQASSRPTTSHVASTAPGDNWWMEADARFARNYGRTNPDEDMGVTFEAYFERTFDEGVFGDGTSITAGLSSAEDIPEKIQFLDRLFASLR